MFPPSMVIFAPFEAFDGQLLKNIDPLRTSSSSEAPPPPARPVTRNAAGDMTILRFAHSVR